MKSLQITRAGGPEVFKLLDLPSPTMVTDGVRIQVKAAGVNFADLMMRMGMYPEAPKMPFTPGYEVAGIVSEVGPQVRAFKPGDRVLAACKFGGYTDEIVLQEYQVRGTPAHLSDAEAAAIPVNFMTAWVALKEMARVRNGDRVLIPSAAGGVGTAAVQIAAQAGAHVVGLVGTSSKVQAVRDLGAQETMTNDEWESASDRDAGGFDIILDATGGTSLKRAMRRLAKAGRVVNFGVSSFIGGEKRNLPKVLGALIKTPILTPFQLMDSSTGIFGLNMLKVFEPPAPGESLAHTSMGRAFDGTLQAFEERRFRVIVGKSFPLAEAGAAHSHLQSRGNIGKVVLNIE
jgi:NADPH:quinone reductase-like Zn-dependent oxidoreductase